MTAYRIMHIFTQLTVLFVTQYSFIKGVPQHQILPHYLLVLLHFHFHHYLSPSQFHFHFFLFIIFNCFIIFNIYRCIRGNLIRISIYNFIFCRWVGGNLIIILLIIRIRIHIFTIIWRLGGILITIYLIIIRSIDIFTIIWCLKGILIIIFFFVTICSLARIIT